MACLVNREEVRRKCKERQYLNARGAWRACSRVGRAAEKESPPFKSFSGRNVDMCYFEQKRGKGYRCTSVLLFFRFPTAGLTTLNPCIGEPRQLGGLRKFRGTHQAPHRWSRAQCKMPFLAVHVDQRPLQNGVSATSVPPRTNSWPLCSLPTIRCLLDSWELPKSPELFGPTMRRLNVFKPAVKTQKC